MERPCAWPTLYLEINGNDDDEYDLFCIYVYGLFVLLRVNDNYVSIKNKHIFSRSSGMIIYHPSSYWPDYLFQHLHQCISIVEIGQFSSINDIEKTKLVYFCLLRWFMACKMFTIEL